MKLKVRGAPVFQKAKGEVIMTKNADGELEKRT